MSNQDQLNIYANSMMGSLELLARSLRTINMTQLSLSEQAQVLLQKILTLTPESDKTFSKLLCSKIEEMNVVGSQFNTSIMSQIDDTQYVLNKLKSNDAELQDGYKSLLANASKSSEFNYTDILELLTKTVPQTIKTISQLQTELTHSSIFTDVKSLETMSDYMVTTLKTKLKNDAKKGVEDENVITANTLAVTINTLMQDQILYLTSELGKGYEALAVVIEAVSQLRSIYDEDVQSNGGA